MEENTNESGLSFLDIIHILKKRIVAIIIALVIGIGAAGVYAFTLNPVSYRAEACIYTVFSSSESGDPSASDVNYGRLAPKTFVDSLLSDSSKWKLIYNKVVEDNDALEEKIWEDQNDIPSYQVIGSRISASYDDSLQSLMFTVAYTSPIRKEVPIVTNAICEALKEATEIDRQQNPIGPLGYFVLSYGEDVENSDVYTISRSRITILMLGAIAGLVIGLGYVFIREVTDQKIHSKKTVEEICDMKIIGLIPDFDEKKVGKGE